MTLLEMKKKVLGMIEEVAPNHENLTEDPDIAAKFNDVTNQVMFEMARMKKIPKYVEFEVKEGEIIDFSKIEKESGYEVYQINTAKGVNNEFVAQGTLVKVFESGTLCVDFSVYPERITEKTKDKGYEFELTPDVLEIMPYGVAADLLKSDVSAEYGNIYAARYEAMKQNLDPRFQMTTVYVDGGYDI